MNNLRIHIFEPEMCTVPRFLIATGSYHRWHTQRLWKREGLSNFLNADGKSFNLIVIKVSTRGKGLQGFGLPWDLLQ